MAKARTQFICQNCGTVHARWVGKCEGCNQWNTIVEEDPMGGIGGGIGVDEIGAASGTIGYEVLTSLGRRYHRVYKGG